LAIYLPFFFDGFGLLRPVVGVMELICIGIS
jgi:hypothetical protein